MATNKDQLTQQAKTLGIDTEGLTVAQLQEAIDKASDEVTETPVLNATQLRQQKAQELKAKRAKEAAKKQKQQAVKAEESAAKLPKKEEKDNRKVFTDERGLKFRFKKSAPKSLNIDGASTSIKELIENEEVMLELVNGNSNFIEQIY